MNYEIIEFNGKPARKYPDGAIRNEKGQLMQFPPSLEGKNIQNSEQASALAKRRKQLYLEAIEQGLQDAAPGYGTPHEAVRHIIKKRAQVAMSDEGRAGNDAARLVLEAADALQDKKQENVQVQRMEYTIDEETRALIMEIAHQKREA